MTDPTKPIANWKWFLTGFFLGLLSTLLLLLPCGTCGGESAYISATRYSITAIEVMVKDYQTRFGKMPEMGKRATAVSLHPFPTFNPTFYFLKHPTPSRSTLS